jgi:hypothetical protein
MTDERILELVSAGVDGELNGDEQIELNSLLESSAEARELQSELEELDSLLSNVPDIEPPSSLHAQIMARVEQQSTKTKSSAVSWWRDLMPGAGLRYALATGAGALIALIVVGGVPSVPNTVDYSDLVGTMSPGTDLGSTEILDSFSFRQEGLESRIQLRLSRGIAFLDILANTEQPLDISVDPGDAGQAVQVQALGQQRLTILLHREDDAVRNGEARITLEISSEGKLLEQGELKASW